MVILDVTVVNVALPSIQTDLGMALADLHWVLTAYTLAFGGLLLLSGPPIRDRSTVAKAA